MRLFSWFVNLSAVGGFFGWWGMCITYTRFCTWFLQNFFVYQCLILLRRRWLQGTGPRPHTTCLLQQFATLAFVLGYLLVDPFHSYQRSRRLLGLQCLRIPHRLHQHSLLCRSLLRLEASQTHKVLEAHGDGLRHWYSLNRGNRNPRRASQEPRRKDCQNPLLSGLPLVINTRSRMCCTLSRF